MDSATRIKVLGRLAQSNTPDADEAIGRACELAFATLAESKQYEAIEFAIEALATVGFRRCKAAVAAISSFMRSVETRHLEHSDEYGALAEVWTKYRNAYTLMRKSIEVLSGLRYLHTCGVVDTLLWASTHAEESVRKDATSALSGVAKYNLSVYYGEGTESGRGIGATPQLQIMDTLEGMSDVDLKTHLHGVLTLLEGMLSTSMEFTQWSSNTMTLSRATTPANGDVVAVRQRSISFLIKLYSLFEINSQKLSIIRALNAATRAQNMRVEDKSYEEMISANAQEVLAFFAQIVGHEDLQVVQKIENDSYWIHYHSPSDNVKSAALEVKALIDDNKEYAIYKILVGFESVFGNWSTSQRDESFALGSQESRIRDAIDIASRVASDGFEVWRRRILAFAQTESNDLATFPVFYEFLAEVANLFPDFALDLLNKDSDQLSKFLIPILRGLWDSEKYLELLPLIQRWVRESRPEETSILYACTKLFLSTKHVDIKLLSQILDKATELKSEVVLRQVASVAIARSVADQDRDQLKDLFLRALSRLTELQDANWVREIWFRKETMEMISALSGEERRGVLENLRILPQIDYQAEDVLAVFAGREPRDVVEFLCARIYDTNDLAKAVAEEEGVEYEELPFQFHSLQPPLSSDPMMVVQKVLDCYRKDSSLFAYRGAKLLQIIFPHFSEPFSEALVKLVREGADPEMEFVAGVLRAYSGETFIHPVAKELIKRLPPGSPLVNEVEIALESTGVVVGEFGMAEAYEKKRIEVLDWFQDPDERIRNFASKYIAELEGMRDRERVRAEESIALRKFNFGEE
jgi:hypothetical protein